MGDSPHTGTRLGELGHARPPPPKLAPGSTLSSIKTPSSALPVCFQDHTPAKAVGNDFPFVIYLQPLFVQNDLIPKE